jgi:hypothetical protein
MIIMAREVDTPGDPRPEFNAFVVFLILALQVISVPVVAAWWVDEPTETVFQTSVNTDFPDFKIVDYSVESPVNFTPRYLYYSLTEGDYLSFDLIPYQVVNQTDSWTLLLPNVTGDLGGGFGIVEIPFIMPDLDTYLIHDIEINIQASETTEWDSRQFAVGGYNDVSTVNASKLTHFIESPVLIDAGSVNTSLIELDEDIPLVDSLDALQKVTGYDNHFGYIRLLQVSPLSGWLTQTVTFNVTVNGTLQRANTPAGIIYGLLGVYVIIDLIMWAAITPYFNPTVLLTEMREKRKKEGTKGGGK